MTNIAMLIKLSYSDQILIEKITAGCEQFVENMESQWYHPRVIYPKISEGQLVKLSTVFPSLSKSSSGSFRPFPEVRSKLGTSASVDPAIVYRSLRTLVNINYYEKTNFGKRKHSEISGRNVHYSETNNVSNFKEIVTRPESRTIIYNKLSQSGILERYLRVCNYCSLLMKKHVDVESAIRGRKAIGNVEQEQQIDSYKTEYVNAQKLLKNKSNRELFAVACKLAKKDLQNKPIEDKTYTRFFVGGGISFGEIESSPLK